MSTTPPTKKLLSTKQLEVSELWQDLNKRLYDNIDDIFLANFRNPHNPANRFSTWPPMERTYRYYLTLVFNEVRKKDKDFFVKYRMLGDVQLGQPLSVSASGVQVNLDYLTSFEEYEFLSESISLDRITSVVEIGAGFGRTAHTLLKLSKGIQKYVIVDLPPMLKLSKKYLKQVLPDEFGKLQFISAQSIDQWKKVNADLAINIDSFQEMTKHTIMRYIDNLFSKISFVYIKNPVCKYDSKLLGIRRSRKNDVFSLGLVTEIADIFNETKLVEMREIYEKKYCPSQKHQKINALPSNLFAYYQHVLYEQK